MRPSSSWVRGVTCALALAVLSSPAAADGKKRHGKKTTTSVASCTSFDQRDREDEGLDLVVTSRCEVKLSCSVSWSLTCRTAAGKTRRSQHGAAFSLVTDASETTPASPADCGNDGFAIDDVVWSCQPDRTGTDGSVATR